MVIHREKDGARKSRLSVHLYLFKGAEDFGAQGVVVVVHHVFYLPCPVDNDALQVLNEILRLGRV